MGWVLLTPDAEVAWGDSGQRLRSGAFAPDFPVVIFVVAYGNCLQIPSGLSTPLAPQATPAPGCVIDNLASAGAGSVLRARANDGVGWNILRGPLHAGRAGGLVERTHRFAS